MLSPNLSREGGHQQAKLANTLLETTRRMGYYTDKGKKTSEKMKPFLEVTRNICVVLTMSVLSVLQKWSWCFAHNLQESSINCARDHHSQKT